MVRWSRRITCLQILLIVEWSLRYPNFLHLPLEIREKICEFLFSEEVKPFSNEDKPRGDVILKSRINRSPLDSMIPTSILHTCREIHDEALKVLRRTRTAQFTCNGWQPGKPHLRLCQLELVFKFRNIRLTVRSPVQLVEYNHIDWDQREKGALKNLLYHFATQFMGQTQNSGCAATRAITLDIRVTRPRILPRGGTFRSRWHSRIWLIGQVRFAIEKWREDLRCRMPTDGLRLRSTWIDSWSFMKSSERVQSWFDTMTIFTRDRLS